MRFFAAAAALLVPFALGACGDDGSGPERREPGSIAISESDIDMLDGDTVQISVSVFDEDGEEFAEIPDDVDIFFTTQTPSIVQVLQDGRIVALHPGTGTIRAATSDGLIDELTVLVIPVPTSVEIVDGGDQDGLPNTALPDSVVVRVEDRHGDGVPGVEVQFAVTSGGGSVSPTSAITDADGEVRVEWTLGPVVGDQAIEATAAVASAAVAINATISNVVFTGVDVPATVTQGASLPGAVRIDSNQFSHAIGAGYVVVSWDPTKLALANVANADYARSVHRIDAASGQLHLIVTDPDVTKGDRAAAGITFNVIGGAGTTTTIHSTIQSLISENFTIVQAGVADDVVVTIN